MRSICLCLLPVALWVVSGVFCLVSLRVWGWFILVMMVGVMFGFGIGNCGYVVWWCAVCLAGFECQLAVDC